MPTILVSDEPYDSVTSCKSVTGRTEKRVVDRLDEPIPEEGDPCIWKGRPCILYGMWDMAEDWSGELVTFPHPYAVAGSLKIGVSEFWALVRQVHGL